MNAYWDWCEMNSYWSMLSYLVEGYRNYLLIALYHRICFACLSLIFLTSNNMFNVNIVLFTPSSRSHTAILAWYNVIWVHCLSRNSFFVSVTLSILEYLLRFLFTFYSSLKTLKSLKIIWRYYPKFIINFKGTVLLSAYYLMLYVQYDKKKN